MTITRRIAALTLLTAAALPIDTGLASATPQTRHLDPPVSVQDCEEGGGWLAVDIRERRLFCHGGQYNDRYIKEL
ncbi:hypothetical protein ACIRS1_34765 [Kitasatospora sp. NPDC101176]|uniref:hypothetical protein n=1 Tax=Kitasatospora sp. NPDC101176 TaxID=3364099 RepID=UPI003817CA84